MSVKPVVVGPAVMTASYPPNRKRSLGFARDDGSCMNVARLFVEADLSASIETPLTEAQAHYLRHVMRRGEGAPLRLFNGRDGEWKAVLSLRGRKGAVATAAERTREQAAEPDVWLCFAPVKRARIDY